MRLAIGLILLLGATLLQVTLVMRVNMLQGAADLVLLTMVVWMMQEGNKPDWRWGIPAGLMVGYATALPDWLMWIGYLATAGVCQLLFQRVLQVRLLTLVISVLAGSLVIQLFTLAYLWFGAQQFPLTESFNSIVLPSMLLNLILVLPVNAIISELNKLLPAPELA